VELMQARVVTALSGARWLPHGWRLFKAAPIGWISMVFAYTFLITLTSVLPMVGVVAATMMVPGFSVSFMAASRAAERGQEIGFSTLFAGFRENPRAQLALGALYAVSVTLVLAATTLVDDGSFARWLATGKRPSPDTLRTDGFQYAMLVAATLYALVMMLFWFSPVLAAWHRMAVPKALFFSFFGVLLNWRAFIAYGIVTGVVTVLVPFATIFALTALTSGKAQLTAAGLLFPVLLLIMPTLFGSFYASYRDVFGSEAAE
jgi:hypothetical protein